MSSCCEEAREQAACIFIQSVSRTYATAPHGVHHQLTECVWGCPHRLPRDPPATDDRPVEVSPGEGGGAAGVLPAAE